MSASRRVLVVEDEPTIRIVLGEYLRDEGFEVDDARDGASALRLARRTVPDVAVVDLMLPVLDGPTLLASWVHDDVLGEVPVVLISAGPRLSEVAREVGARATLAKPFDLDILGAVIEQVLAHPEPPPAAPTLPAD